MRLGYWVFFAALATACPALAVAGDTQAINVRYAVNMEFLPPLLGERTCLPATPCEIVRLDHFTLILIVAAEPAEGRSDRLTIDCSGRECALKDGRRSIDFSKNKRFVHFKVDNREYALNGRTVLRYRGDEIGEILLAY